MKLKTIVDTLATRLANILQTGSYNTDIGKYVYRGQGQVPDERNACSIYLGNRTAEETKGERQKVEATVTIEAVHSFTSNPENLAIETLSDIQKAIEVEDATFSKLLYTPGFQWVSDSIEYPENSEYRVAVQVTYSIPHIRHFGDADS